MLTASRNKRRPARDGALCRLARLATITTLAATAGVGIVASPAAAATARDGVCDDGEYCFFYNSNMTGSVFDISEYDVDLRNNKFPRGNAKGKIVGNNTASYWNRTDNKFCVYTNINYGGTEGWMSGGKADNFSATFKNNVESVQRGQWHGC